MKTFNVFLKEMAVITGVMPSNYLSFENDWNKHYKEKLDKPILKDLGSLHSKIYIIGSSHYILTDENDEYLGYLELTNLGNGKYKIGASNSKLKDGFYSIMFISLLSLDEYDELFSDTQLNTQAAKSYEKLSSNPRLSINIMNVDNSLSPFSISNLTANPYNRVSIKASHKEHLKETFEGYYKKIYSDSEICMFRNEFLNKSVGIDIHLFSETAEIESKDI